MRSTPSPSSAGICLLLAGLAASGCRVGPDYVPPEVKLPDTWHRALTQGLETGEANLQTWWKLLGDEELNALMKRVDGNLSLDVAFARVKEARALLRIAGGDRMPQLTGFGSAIRSKTGSGIPLPGAGTTNNFYSTGIDATWEIDVWGRVSRIVESASAGYDASIENLRDVLVVLYSEIAINYVELRSLQERIQLTQANIKLQQDTLKLTQDRFNAQLVSELDVRQAELNLARTQAFLPSLRAAVEAAIHRIEVLLGQNPGGELHTELSKVGAVPKHPERVRLAMPYNLLRQRPDVRRAERELASQTARIGIATADLYPQFSLFGGFSFDSIGGSLTDMFRKSSLSWSFGPQFSWSLFSGGKVEGNIEAETARTEALVAGYKQTVLLALEETENALVGYTEELNVLDALRRSTAAARKSVELVQTLYRTGRVDFQNVLDMQRSLVTEEDKLAESEGRVIQNLIRLYKALGGGWAEGDPVVDESQPGGSTSQQPK